MGAWMGKTGLWALEDHVCRICMGRVVSRAQEAAEAAGGASGVRVYRCTNCAAQATGVRASCVCACGMKSSRGADLNIRCVPNPHISPEVPGEFVAQEITAPTR